MSEEFPPHYKLLDILESHNSLLDAVFTQSAQAQQPDYDFTKMRKVLSELPKPEEPIPTKIYVNNLDDYLPFRKINGEPVTLHSTIFGMPILISKGIPDNTLLVEYNNKIMKVVRLGDIDDIEEKEEKKIKNKYQTKREVMIKIIQKKIFRKR